MNSSGIARFEWSTSWRGSLDAFTESVAGIPHGTKFKRKERTSMAQPAPTKSQNFPEPPVYFCDALEDAERLLKYACETGIEVPDGVRDDVLGARAASSGEWDESIASNLLTALAKLAALPN
jgi:hypothetical protein